MPPLLESETLGETVSFCGRVLTDGELDLVRQIIADFPRLSRAELAFTICELLQWRRPNGKLKSPECVEWLEKWQQQLLPGLPELRVTKPRGAHRLLATRITHAWSTSRCGTTRLANVGPGQAQHLVQMSGSP